MTKLIHLSSLSSAPFVPSARTAYGDSGGRASSASSASCWCTRSATNWCKSRVLMSTSTRWKSRTMPTGRARLEEHLLLGKKLYFSTFFLLLSYLSRDLFTREYLWMIDRASGVTSYAILYLLVLSDLGVHLCAGKPMTAQLTLLHFIRPYFKAFGDISRARPDQTSTLTSSFCFVCVF